MQRNKILLYSQTKALSESPILPKTILITFWFIWHWYYHKGSHDIDGLQQKPSEWFSVLIWVFPRYRVLFWVFLRYRESTWVTVLLLNGWMTAKDQFQAPKEVYRASPGWCVSVDWVLACKPKGRWFNSQAGHMPGLWARSPMGGAHERQPHIDVCLPLILPPFLCLQK